MAMDHPKEDLVICSVHMSLVHKTKLLILNLVILMRILSGAYPPFCLLNFRKCSISHG